MWDVREEKDMEYGVWEWDKRNTLKWFRHVERFYDNWLVKKIEARKKEIEYGEDS